MKITKTSLFSNITRTLDLNITLEQLERIEKGDDLIQNIVPHLTAEEREFLLTGIINEEWDVLFKEEDES